MSKRRNPGELMLLENPYMGGFDYLGNLRKPRRKHRRNTVRNPLSALGVKPSWTQGVGLIDAAAAVAGLAGAAYFPSLVVKDTSTASGKALKLVASLGATIVVGMAFKKFAPGASKAAVIGGMAGTVATALGMFTGIKIPGISGASTNLGYIRRLGEAIEVSPRTSREGETVTILQP